MYRPATTAGTNRRRLLGALGSLAALGALALGRPGRGSAEQRGARTLAPRGGGAAVTRLQRDPEYWRQYGSASAWAVLFRERTERPWSSPLNDETRDGTYVCAACRLPLFDSAAKYESGTGWPSVHTVIDAHVGTRRDFRLILPRTEYHCLRCGGHQGHVFDDGPQPTGRRWCNNGLALEFVPRGQPLPALRG